MKLLTPKNNIVLFIVISSFIGFEMTPYMGLASLAYGCLCSGLLTLHHKQRHLHHKFMLTGIGLDLILVLTLEFQRGAVETAVEFKLGPLQQLHILASLIAVLMYFPLIYLGFRLLKDKTNMSIRKRHKLFARIGFVARTLGFFLMFSMLKSK